MVTKKDSAKGAVGDESTEVAEFKASWGEVGNWDEAVAALGNVVFNSTEEFGDGSVKVGKEQLLGVRFLLLEFTFHVDKKTNREYVNVLLMAENGKKAWFNDGSTGIYRQLKHFEKKRMLTGGILCESGLRVSEYEHTDERTGEVSMASTYYLA
jgi:hypothetical protein